MHPDPQPWWRDRTVWALSLLGAAIVLALTSLVKTSALPVQWGTVADWAAAVGSIVAAVVAVGIAVHGNERQDRREQAEQRKAEDRARRRASRIELSQTWSSTNAMEAKLQNNGPTDLYELEWFAPLLFQSAEDDQLKFVVRAEGTTVSDARKPLATRDPETIAPGQSRRIFVPVAMPTGAENRRPTMAVLVTYVDADGYRIGRVYPRNTNPNNPRIAMPTWAVVDDDYPNSAGGLLSELFKKLDD